MLLFHNYMPNDVVSYAVIIASCIIWGIISVSIDERKAAKKARERMERFKAFLQVNEGGRFFVYTNSSKTQLYIEQNILPLLPGDMHVIFIEGKVRTTLDYEMIVRMFYHKRFRGGFPCLYRIVGGMVYVDSLEQVLKAAIKHSDPTVVTAAIEALQP